MVGEGLIARFSNTRPVDPSFHHGSHRQLLEAVPADQAPQTPVDALIVPASRPYYWLRGAMLLASRLGCRVVVLCSDATKPGEIVDLGKSMGAAVLTVNVADSDCRLPVFSADDFLLTSPFGRFSDSSRKRNAGLLLSLLVGWERVLFLDDDIYSIESIDARAAVGLLEQYEAVGIDNRGFPDNSIVCHVNRELGETQAQFIGAGALAVTPMESRSYFPDVYNQDWFFLLGCGQPLKLAVTGEMRRRDRDPFADPDRARREELGDCLAEGLFWLMDHGLAIAGADAQHWADFLNRRAYFIEHLISQARKQEWGDREDRVLASLEVARDTNALISPSLCVEYMRRWRADLETWRTFILQQPVGLGIERALAYLDLPGTIVSLPPGRIGPDPYEDGDHGVPGIGGMAWQRAGSLVNDSLMHHGSHRHLLAPHSPTDVRASAVDALVVPTGRPITWLCDAMALAGQLNCALLVLCSREANAADVAKLAEEFGVVTVALDVGDYEGLLPTPWSEELLDGTELKRDSDVTEKRNFGLVLARMAGWERVLYLDDDIRAVNPAAIRMAAGLLDRYFAVGLHNHGFQDNSVVCHAYRELGGKQSQFVGAGALAVAPLQTHSFFPTPYNDDWLFLIGDAQPPRIAVTGSMRQSSYDPFASPERARSEEYGDCLAEGLYWLLDDGRTVAQADCLHWKDFLVRRIRFIDRLLRRTELVIADVDRRRRMYASLEVALRTCRQIEPELCAEYLVRWRVDLEIWQQFMAGVPIGLGVDEALNKLGLGTVAHRYMP